MLKYIGKLCFSDISFWSNNLYAKSGMQILQVTEKIIGWLRKMFIMATCFRASLALSAGYGFKG